MRCQCSRYRDFSNTDISKYPLISKNIVQTELQFYLHFNSCYLKLLLSQSKFSAIRKFTLRYQWFGKNFNFEITRVGSIRNYFIIIGIENNNNNNTESTKYLLKLLNVEIISQFPHMHSKY